MEQLPIALRVANLQQQLVNDINESGLPPAITQFIVKDVFDVVKNVAQSEYEKINALYRTQHPEYKDPAILDFAKGFKEQMENVEKTPATPLKEVQNG